ncbi:NYN domain-containing protein [Nitriliruptoraceae bacterium ZYF776]|nr:NYN domain-containing protein [Profundirhabdus halotolerans]
MNVVGSRPDGWWRDRPAAVRRLADELQHLPDAEVVLVADGAPNDHLADGAHGTLTVRFAAVPGAATADDLIVDLVRDAGDRHVEVVTADRELRDRVTALGAAVVGPRTLLDCASR